VGCAIGCVVPYTWMAASCSLKKLIMPRPAKVMKIYSGARGNFPESLMTLRMPCRMAAAMAAVTMRDELKVARQYPRFSVRFFSLATASVMRMRSRWRVGSG